MDRFRHKNNKKRKQPIQNDDARLPLFATDVKTIKENLKIKEILRTVKINRSMRVKAPRGSKVISNNDLIDPNECDTTNDVENNVEKYSSNSDDNRFSLRSDGEIMKAEPDDEQNISTSLSALPVDLEKQTEIDDEIEVPIDSTAKFIEDSNVNSEQQVKDTYCGDSPNLKDTLPCLPTINMSDKPLRVRKLSLDQTMLARKASLSQSELNLNIMGKMPLERKSSFFRKKMDNFFENTSKIFKRQSLSTADVIHRRGSMSCSSQSLNDATNYNNKFMSSGSSQELPHGSMSSLNSSTVGCSSSSGPSSKPESPNPKLEQAGLSTSECCLSVSQPGGLSESVHSLNEAYIQEQMLNSRAISMSSGLDSATKETKKRASRANRVTWLASEGLTNYLRRVIQDEKSKDEAKQESPSKTDSRVRRLSYHRAVSGEDPSRLDSSMRRRRPLIPEHSEANYELANLLADFTANGVPPMQDFKIFELTQDALNLLYWADDDINIQVPSVHVNELARQTVIKELITTEVDYIKHLITIVQVFMAAAHALQKCGWLLDVETERLFSNLPDVLNGSLIFWETSIYPMLVDAVKRQTIFNTELMYNGFYYIRDYFLPYDKYVTEQSNILAYLRSLSKNADFMLYLNWCNSHHSCNRLQLSDMLSKPMQRVTKYSLLLRRIINHTDIEPERTMLIAMELLSKNLINDLNRSIRRRDELELIDKLSTQIDLYEQDFKDDEMDRLYRMYSGLNLSAPMAGCLPIHSRTLVYEGDVRFRDAINPKEMEVRAFLLTDMLLICKKVSKGTNHTYKLIRPKYMLTKLLVVGQYNKHKTTKELVALLFLSLDDVGSSQQCFSFTDPLGKDNNSFVKLWDAKLREARLTYDLGVWMAKNPSREMTENELDTSSPTAKSPGQRTLSEEDLEREARERVATMLHYMGASTEHEYSQNSVQTDSLTEDPTVSVARVASTQMATTLVPPSSSSQASSTTPTQISEPPPTEQVLPIPLSTQTLTPVTTHNQPLPTQSLTVPTRLSSHTDTLTSPAPTQTIISADVLVPSNDKLTALDNTVASIDILAPPNNSLDPSSDILTPSTDNVILSTDSESPAVAYSTDIVAPPTHNVVPSTNTVAPPDTVLPLNDSIVPSNDTVVQKTDTAVTSTNTVVPTTETLPSATKTLSLITPTLSLPTYTQPPSGQPHPPLTRFLPPSSQSLPIPIPVPHGPPTITKRHFLHRTSTGGSSRLSSFQKTISATSRDEIPPPVLQPALFLHRPGSAWETVPSPPDYRKSTSITVNVLNERDSETRTRRRSSPKPPSRSPSSSNTLKVQPQAGVMALVHSLPDLTIEYMPASTISQHVPQPMQSLTASQKLYRSHQELLLKNRLLASRTHSTHHLSPHHRGSSYPPPSPTRGALRRGLAFSYSFKAPPPPLSKMDHVDGSGTSAHTSTCSLDQSSRSSTLTKNKDKVQSQNSEMEALNSVSQPSTSTKELSRSARAKQFLLKLGGLTFDSGEKEVPSPEEPQERQSTRRRPSEPIR